MSVRREERVTHPFKHQGDEVVSPQIAYSCASVTPLSDWVKRPEIPRTLFLKRNMSPDLLESVAGKCIALRCIPLIGFAGLT